MKEGEYYAIYIRPYIQCKFAQSLSVSVLYGEVSFVLDALQKIKDKPGGKFSLQWYIERDGEVKGTELYNERVKRLKEISYKQRNIQKIYDYMDELNGIVKPKREPKPKKVKVKIIKPKVKRPANNKGIPMSEAT